MAEKRKYDSTVARIAGNIASGLGWDCLNQVDDARAASLCVGLARAIVAEVERTESSAQQGEPCALTGSTEPKETKDG